MPRTKKTRAELARVKQGLESRDSDVTSLITRVTELSAGVLV